MANNNTFVVPNDEVIEAVDDQVSSDTYLYQGVSRPLPKQHIYAYQAVLISRYMVCKQEVARKYPRIRANFCKRPFYDGRKCFTGSFFFRQARITVENAPSQDALLAALCVVLVDKHPRLFANGKIVEDEEANAAQVARVQQKKFDKIQRKVIPAQSDDETGETFPTWEAAPERISYGSNLSSQASDTTRSDNFFDFCQQVIEVQTLLRKLIPTIVVDEDRHYLWKEKLASFLASLSQRKDNDIRICVNFFVDEMLREEAAYDWSVVVTTITKLHRLMHAYNGNPLTIAMKKTKNRVSQLRAQHLLNQAAKADYEDVNYSPAIPMSYTDPDFYFIPDDPIRDEFEDSYLMDDFDHFISHLEKRFALSSNGGYSEWLQRLRNKMQHAIDGNINTKGKLNPELKKKIDLKIKQAIERGRKPKKQILKPSVIRPPKPKRFGTPYSGPNIGGGQIQVPGSSKADEFERVMLAMMNPMSTLPIRWNDGYSTVPTAIANPWEVTTVDWGSTSPKLAASGDMCGFAFRSLTNASIRYMCPASLSLGGGAITYTLKGKNNGSLASKDAIPATSFTVDLLDVSFKVPLHVPFASYSGSATGTQVHGATWYAKSADGTQGDSRRYYWLQAGDSMALTLHSDVSCNVDTFLDYYDEGGNEEGVVSVIQSALTTSDSVITVNVVQDGYYAPSMMNMTGNRRITIVSAKFNLVITNGIWAHRPASGFEANFSTAKAPRVYAVAMMYSNEASEFDAEGKLVGYQFQPGSLWNEVTTFRKLSASSGSVLKKAKTGIYGYLKPTDVSDFATLNEFETSNGSLLDCYAPVTTHSGYLAVYASVTVSAGQDALWTFAEALDYQTDDTWRPIGRPIYKAAVYKAAIEALQNQQQWFDNPAHFLAIWQGITKAAKAFVGGVNRYGPRTVQLMEEMGSRS